MQWKRDILLTNNQSSSGHHLVRKFVSKVFI